MTGPDSSIVEHYGAAGLYDRILAALRGAGVDPAHLSADDLKAVDEFHIGGVSATEHLLDPLGFDKTTRVLDLGSGIGGPARFMSGRYAAQVTGIDLTPEFVDTARRLNDDLGMDADFVVGSALDLPFDDQSFDAATLIHVGMNLPDKPRLFAEASRVLKDGGVFAVYDVMLFGSPPDFPLPWATTPEASFLDTPEAYLQAAAQAGLTLTHRADRGDVARDFFARMQAAIAAKGPPAVGLPILMGETAPQKAANMAQAVGRNDIQPVEMIFTKG